MKIILQAIGGSHAYGLDTESSDVDRYGVFVEPLSSVISLKHFTESIVTNDPDVSLHEVGKFVRLAAQGNPTILDQLFMPEYEIMTWEGERLVKFRGLFLSKRIYKSYGGYAIDQVRRLNNRDDGSFSSEHRNRYEKHARHCFRLLQQGRQLLETGNLNVRVDNREELFEIGKLPPSDLMTRFETEFKKFDQIETKLPDLPDYDKINDLLLAIRSVNNDL